MSLKDEDEETIEHTLLVVREVSAYKIPPRTNSGGYKCGEWLQSDKIWSGRMRLVSVGEVCEIRLEDASSGELFAACHVLPGKRDICVEPALDSSRYFVLRIDDGRGKHAFIGLGFTERNEAFDFNVALSDHEKHASRVKEKQNESFEQELSQNSSPALDLRLKEGETIRINVKTKPTSNLGMLSNAGSAGSGLNTGRVISPLAPPPAVGKVRSPLPPPPNDTRPLRASNTGTMQQTKRSMDTRKASGDPFADLSQLEQTSLPSSSFKSGTAPNKSSHTGWAAF